MSSRLLAAAALLSLTSTTILASPIYGEEHFHRRQIITTSELQSSYDFVIAGGGLAGLVLASRLSDDANKTVLVLEAGDTGDAVRSRIDIPNQAYFHGLVGTEYDWAYITTPQENLGSRNLSWPRGKVLGGSAAMNGMYMVRPSAREMDTWASLQGNETGASAWGWDSMFAAMKKSETFNPPSAAIQAEGNILYDPASHGTSGPLDYSYPGFLLPIVGDWEETLEMIGIPQSPDANGGAGWGAFIATSSINPSNWTRSYSKSAYIDPLPPRSNLHILPNATVTKLVFTQDPAGGGLKATSVEYASSGYQTKPWPTVGVNREVLLAGGAIGSPNILMQSGIGPEERLKAAGVAVNYPLPGVGRHVQDHVSTQVVFTTNADTSKSLHDAGADQAFANGTANPIQSFINNAIAYANISDLLGNYSSTFQQEIGANLSAYALDTTMNPSGGSGYTAIYQATLDNMLSQIGQVELLLSLTGTQQGGAKSFAIQAALQHPYSQGELYIATPNPFDYPVINPNYFSHPADIIMLREGIKLARTIGQTKPLADSAIQEVWPGSTVQTDDEWDAWLRQNVGTEFHPGCTCAMLPLSNGGVVDTNLIVYGTTNVRVADSSVFPIQFAAHLMAPTYGLAEQAVEIIKAKYDGTASPGGSQTATINPQTRSATETTANPTGTGTTGASQTTSGANPRTLTSVSSSVTLAVILAATLFLS